MDYPPKAVTLSLRKSQSTMIKTIVTKDEQNQGMRASGSYFQFLQKPPQVKLQHDQKQIIAKIVKELTTEANKQGDLSQVLKMNHIQNMLREQFKLSDKEIAGLEAQIINQCRDIIEHDGQHAVANNLSSLKRNSLVSRNQNIDDNLKAVTHQNEEGFAGLLQQTKSQPLTMLQRKELERYNSLEYFKFPVQPCVRSLYYLSKIAQNQSIRIIIPPTVLIGFGDDNRIMYNDVHTGKLVVENKHISPKRIQNFIQSHMINGAEQQAYSIEGKLMYPKFVIKLAGKGSTKNEIKLYYSRESLIADLLSFWGSYDLALQLFVKQKHPFRPCIYRCYANKNGNIYKAIAVSNQDNYGKDSKFQRTLKQMIEDTHNKSKRIIHQRGDSNQKRVDANSNSSPTKHKSQMQHQLEGFFLRKVDRIGKARKSINFPNGTLLQKSLIGVDLLKEAESKEIEQELNQPLKKLDSKGFPLSLEYFKLNDYQNQVQQCMPNSELKTAFICTSDNIDNLTMMNCRPSALQQASLMTQDLFRLFSQYYLKIHKFGHINQFICDFMEDHNGLMYFLQVKSFECEGVLHEWQIPYNPAPKITLSPEKIQEEKEELQQDLVRKCNAQIICRFPGLMKWLIKACTDLDIWEGTTKRVPEQQVKKYQIEVEVGKESFCLQSEQQRICPLYPLVTFCDYPKHSLFKINQRTDINQPQKCLDPTELTNIEPLSTQLSNQQNSNTISPIKLTNSEEQQQEHGECMVSVCAACFKIIEMFQARYYALVFKTEQTVDELRRLKLKLVNHWTFDNVLFLVTVYKDSKKSLYVVNEIEKLEKRAFEQAVRERAKSPNSVIRKSIKNLRRPLSSYRLIEDGKTGITLTTSSRGMTAFQNNRFDQIIAIDSDCHENDLLTERTINKKPSIFSRNSERSKLKSSKSLLRSIDRFQKQIECIGGVPYDQNKIESISTQRSDKQHKPRFITIKEKPRPMSGVIQNEIISRGLIQQNCNQANIQIQESDHQSLNRAILVNPLIVMNDTEILNNLESKNASIFKKAREINTQPVSSNHQSSGHSTSRKLMQKNTGSKVILNSLIGGSQRSDKDMCDYFNQKRELNINHPLRYVGLKDMQSISSFNQRRQSEIQEHNQMIA